MMLTIRKNVKKQYSPCSTFKIISTLEGLECRAVTSEESTMNYNGYRYHFDLCSIIYMNLYYKLQE